MEEVAGMEVVLFLEKIVLKLIGQVLMQQDGLQKIVLHAGLADRMEVQLSYAIGVSEPISIMVDTHRTNKIPENEIVKKINQNFDLSPGGIIENLNLRRPIYKQTASYGHFGRNDINLPWEELNMIEKLQ